MEHEELKKILFDLFEETDGMEEHAMGDVYKFIRDEFFAQVDNKDEIDNWFQQNYETLLKEYESSEKK